MPNEDIKIIISGEDKGASSTISDAIKDLESLSAVLEKVQSQQGAASGFSMPKIATFDTSGVDQALSGMTEIKDAAGEAASAFEGTKEQLSQVGQEATAANAEVAASAKKGAKAMEREYTKSSNKVVAAFKRILFYRFVRSAIREVGQALKEGIDAYYAYDKERGGDFAKSMDALSSELQYIKYSLGAAVAPLLVSLTPVLLWIGDLLVTVIEGINQFFSAIKAFVTGGEYVYKAVQKPTTTYEALTKQTKKLNATLLKFDEINRLNGSDGSNDKDSDLSTVEKQIDNLTVWFTGAGLGALIGKAILDAWDKIKNKDKTDKGGNGGKPAPQEAFSPNGTVPIGERKAEAQSPQTAPAMAFDAGEFQRTIENEIKLAKDAVHAAADGFARETTDTANQWRGALPDFLTPQQQSAKAWLESAAIAGAGAGALLAAAESARKATGDVSTFAKDSKLELQEEKHWRRENNTKWTTGITDMSQVVTDVARTADGTLVATQDAINAGMEVQENVSQKTGSAMSFLVQVVASVLSMKSKVDSFFGNIGSFLENNIAKPFANAFKNALGFLGIGSAASIFSLPIPLFATGGYPATGQLFVANESGAEMVGQIGQRTAVVNNEQIVDAVSSGVAAANIEGNVLLREQNNLLRQILYKEGTVNVSGHDILSALQNIASRSGIPVGSLI